MHQQLAGGQMPAVSRVTMKALQLERYVSWSDSWMLLRRMPCAVSITAAMREIANRVYQRTSRTRLES